MPEGMAAWEDTGAMTAAAAVPAAFLIKDLLELFFCIGI
jgi:hypothetical protein